MSYSCIRDRLINAIKKNYGFLEWHPEIIDFLENARYSSTGAALARDIETDLRKLSNDNHFSIKYLKYEDLMSFKLPSRDGEIEYKRKGENAFIKVRMFSIGETVEKRYRDIMQDIMDHKVKHVLIDLRHCPGGYVDAAKLLLSFFTPAKRHLFSLYQPYNDGKWSDTMWEYSSGEDVPKYRGRVTVLVDGDTFSSAQIVTHVLKNMCGARVIGEQTMKYSHTSPVYRGITVGEHAFKLGIPNKILMERRGRKYIPMNYQGILPNFKLKTIKR